MDTYWTRLPGDPRLLAIHAFSVASQEDAMVAVVTMTGSCCPITTAHCNALPWLQLGYRVAVEQHSLNSASRKVPANDRARSVKKSEEFQHDDP